jgi:predicted acylesterase/phospholipase RssA
MSSVDVVVQGGGSNVASLAAAAYEVQRRAHIERVCGTSAGGLVALALAFRVDDQRLLAFLQHFLQDNRLLDGDLGTLLTRWGWCRGEVLSRAVRSFIGEGARLGDAAIPIALIVGDMYLREPRILSSWATPDVWVEDAAAATCAIPFVFAPQVIRGLGPGTETRLHCDGGVAANFAMGIFDDHPRPTIGLRPVTPQQRRRPVRTLPDVIWAIAGLRQWAADHSIPTDKPAHVVVDVPAEDGLDFSLAPADTQRRWAAGITAGRAARWGAT